MLRHKNIDRICCVVLAAVLLVTCAYMGAGAAGWITGGRVLGYENRLFDTGRVHTLDIVMEDWEGFLSTCTDEEYVPCHVIIDGESYKNVAIRAKGNTSLSSVQQYGNDRYSFKIEFDHYQPGNSYHGLDKLSLNNLIQDNTYMKDYLAYSLMRKGGAAAPLCSYVQIRVNGETWGLYLAVEGVEDSFLRRNYGNDTGDLYKPDSMSFGGGRGNGKGFDMDDFRQRTTEDAAQSGAEAPAQGGGDAGDEPTLQPVGESGGMPDMQGFSMPEGMTPPAGFDPGSMGGGMPDMGGMPAQAGASANGGTTADGSDPAGDNAPAAEGQPAGTDSPEAAADMQGFSMPEGMTPPAWFDPGSMGGGMPDMGGMPAMPGSGEGGDPGGMGGMGSSDVMLQYADDDPASYSNIFSSAKTDVTEADQQRLIRSLKALSQGDASVVDQQAVIRYLAVHNFLCNDDSYTGAMVHNYYLYEKDGVLTMLPWDYNLAFGGFGMGGDFGSSGATNTVNQPIDSPVTSGELSSRPIISWIFDSEETLAAYHEAYGQFIAEAFESGWFEQEIDRVQSMIAPYVQSDPTAFCTYEEFETGVSTLRAFCLLRAQSVAGQLNGTIPSTEEGQRRTDALVDASHLTLSDMGSMGDTHGGGFGGGRGGQGGGWGRGAQPGGFGDRQGSENGQGGESGQGGQGGGNIQSGKGGESGQGGAAVAQMPPQAGGSGQTNAAPDQPQADHTDLTPTAADTSGRPVPQNRQGYGAPAGASGQTWLLMGVCAIVLAAAIWLVSRYRSNL